MEIQNCLTRQSSSTTEMFHSSLYSAVKVCRLTGWRVLLLELGLVHTDIMRWLTLAEARPADANILVHTTVAKTVVDYFLD